MNINERCLRLRLLFNVHSNDLMSVRFINKIKVRIRLILRYRLYVRHAESYKSIYFGYLFPDIGV